MPLRLTLIRHGVTTWNREKRFQGHQDVPLDPEGLEQARLLAGRLGSEPRPVRVLSSDLQRARRTAAIAEEALGFAVEENLAWRERNMGALQGRTRDELGEEDPALLAAWRADPVGFRPEGGESYADHRARIAAAMAALRDQDGEVWVFTHGGCVYAALAVVAGSELPPDPAFRAGNTSLTRLVATPEGWQVELLDCAAHLPEPSAHSPW